MTTTELTTVTVRYFAGARAAAGRDADQVALKAATVAAVLAEVSTKHAGALDRVLPACSFLLNGTAVHDRAIPAPDGATLDVLPPFAGG
jgi:molybdopterin synthase sulfur carrier subunit